MEAPDFWDDPEKSQSKMKELKSMKDDVATYAKLKEQYEDCLLYTSPSPRDGLLSRMPSSA